MRKYTILGFVNLANKKTKGREKNRKRQRKRKAYERMGKEKNKRKGGYMKRKKRNQQTYNIPFIDNRAPLGTTIIPDDVTLPEKETNP